MKKRVRKEKRADAPERTSARRGIVRPNEQRLFAGSGSGSCSTHSGTRHLNSDNHHFLRRNEFETSKESSPHLMDLPRPEVSHIDRELFGDGVNRGAHLETAYHGHEFTHRHVHLLRDQRERWAQP